MTNFSDDRELYFEQQRRDADQRRAIDPKLLDDLRKFRGLPPYNTPSNYVQGDGYFAVYLRRRYTEAEIAVANSVLDRESRGEA